MENRQKDVRRGALNLWAKQQLDDMGLNLGPDFRIVPASDDASFRRYFRGTAADKGESVSYIFVDAPPDREDSRTFAKVASLLAGCQVLVPEVHRADFDQGYMMLSDLGDRLYLQELGQTGSEKTGLLYEAAFSALLKMRQIKCEDLPVYNELLLREEMNLFTDWFLSQQLKLSLTDEEIARIDAVFRLLVLNATEQPQCFVHRDYHSRNLMLAAENNPGVIDFQDAVFGPVTYDLVSLLKDCYWRFPRSQVVAWVRAYWRTLEPPIDFAGFLRWVDLMGAQRHLKCAGIFSRLHLRDGKAGYLRDIPLVLDYLLEVCDIYPQLSEFGGWIRQRIMPVLASSLKT